MGDDVFRIIVYCIAAFHASMLSVKNGRLFGVGLMIIFGTFIYRDFAHLAWGLTGPDTAMVGDIGAAILIATTLYDMGVDFLRKRKNQEK